MLMRLFRLKRNPGFTLIELLIVVAIIAILAAIAIPNFLAAQVRSKVSRVKAELRTIATGVESYYVDNNAYPYYKKPQSSHFLFIDFTQTLADDPPPRTELTTPISYITSIPRDQFTYSVGGDFWYPYRYSPFLDNSADTYDNVNTKYHGAWILGSAGPNRTFNPIYSHIVGAANIDRTVDLYDPTNGTISGGNIVRSQGGSTPNL